MSSVARKAPLPNLIIGGAQKSGTTTLHHVLASHPDAYFPPEPQEIHFFDLDENFGRGLEWYASLFRGWQGQKVIGQTSPLYLYDERVPERIAATLGEATRFLFTLRHPADRAYSHYWHEIQYGYEGLDFAAALDREAERLRAGYWARRHYSYLDRGRYASQLERFYARFPRENILVVLQDDLRRDPSGVARRCAEFLGLSAAGWDPSQDRSLLHKNPARLPRSRSLQRASAPLRRPGLRVLARLIDRMNLSVRPYPPLPDDLFRRITEKLSGEIERLPRLAGVDVEHWLQTERRRERASA